MQFLIELVGDNEFELRLRKDDLKVAARLNSTDLRELGYACLVAADKPRNPITAEAKLLNSVIQRLLFEVDSDVLVDCIWATTDTALVRLIFESLSTKAATALHADIRRRYAESTPASAPRDVVERARAACEIVTQTIERIRTELRILGP